MLFNSQIIGLGVASSRGTGTVFLVIMTIIIVLAILFQYYDRSMSEKILVPYMKKWVIDVATKKQYFVYGYKVGECCYGYQYQESILLAKDDEGNKRKFLLDEVEILEEII